MRYLSLAILIAVFSCFSAAQAQSSERAEQLRRVVDGLNSPDPVVRLVTFEEAMANKDANLQRIAIQTAFASADQSLRISAVAALFSTKSSIIIEITGGKDSRAQIITQAGGIMEVFINDYDQSNGRFVVTSPYSRKIRDPNNSDNIIPEFGKGHLSGDRISFNVPAGNIANSEFCRGAVTTSQGSPVMTGKMSCNGNPYEIQINLLR